MKKSLVKEADARSPNFLPLVDVLFVIVAFLVLAANFSEKPFAIVAQLVDDLRTYLSSDIQC